jgi:uncharacterized DUF497 family protein
MLRNTQHIRLAPVRDSYRLLSISTGHPSHRRERSHALHIANHGYDFATITVEFFSSATILDAKAGRFNAIGEFDSKVISIIFKPLGIQGRLSVISMRRASRKERAIYDQA